jgi:hypothetical protein
LAQLFEDTTSYLSVTQRFCDLLGLSPLVLAAGPEQDWLPLMRLYRDKIAHLGHSVVFQTVAFADKGNHFYTFLPRTWPFLWHTQLSGEEVLQIPKPNELVPNFVEEDILSYANGLRFKVHGVTSKGLEIINDAYTNLKDSPLNRDALADLEKNSRSYKFEHFATG